MLGAAVAGELVMGGGGSAGGTALGGGAVVGGAALGGASELGVGCAFAVEVNTTHPMSQSIRMPIA